MLNIADEQQILVGYVDVIYRFRKFEMQAIKTKRLI